MPQQPPLNLTLAKENFPHEKIPEGPFGATNQLWGICYIPQPHSIMGYLFSNKETFMRGTSGHNYRNSWQQNNRDVYIDYRALLGKWLGNLEHRWDNPPLPEFPNLSSKNLQALLESKLRDQSRLIMLQLRYSCSGGDEAADGRAIIYPPFKNSLIGLQKITEPKMAEFVEVFRHMAAMYNMPNVPRLPQNTLLDIG